MSRLGELTWADQVTLHGSTVFVSENYLFQKTSNIHAKIHSFNIHSNIHSYNTWSSTSEKFYVKSSRHEIQNNSFSRLGVKPWNKIPSYIMNLPKKAFKRVLCKLLFDILEMEDDYVDIPLIIKKTIGY